MDDNADRTITRTYDAYDRAAKIVYGKGEVETFAYDAYGRLVEIVQDGKRVKYEYGKANRIERQTIDGKTVEFGYTKYGRLQSKTLLSEKGKVTELKYWYGKDGKIVARLANGQMQKYAYDLKGQLVAVTDADGKDVERYVYDPAGNILEKTVGGRKTSYTYDKANQLVSSTDADGKVTEYAYDAAGRLVKEGAKTYRYGYLDKVLAVTEGKMRYTYGYHVDGQLATATRSSSAKRSAKSRKGRKRKDTNVPEPESPSPEPETEEFYWDGLALVKRSGTSYVNEPHPGNAPQKLCFGGKPRAQRSARRVRKQPRGAAVFSSKDGVMFNDILGTTLGVNGEGGYSATPMTAFGDAAESQPSTLNPQPLFTGKPLVDGLGHAFLIRNYRAGLGKWLSADPLGYPDGWNQMAYCGNNVLCLIDRIGGECKKCGGDCHCTIPVYPTLTGDGTHYFMGRNGVPIFNPKNAIMNFLEDNFPAAHYFAAVHDALVDTLTGWGVPDWLINIPTMPAAYVFAFEVANYAKFLDFINYLENLLVDPLFPPINVPYCTCAKE